MPEESNEVQQSQVHPTSAGPDKFLWALVKYADSRNGEVRITLQMSGFLVTGVLVAKARYFEAVGSDFASGFSTTDQVGAERLRQAIGQLGTDDGGSSPSIEFMHLKETLFQVGGKPIPAKGGVWWRGRMSEVSGYFLGSLNMES